METAKIVVEMIVSTSEHLWGEELPTNSEIVKVLTDAINNNPFMDALAMQITQRTGDLDAPTAAEIVVAELRATHVKQYDGYIFADVCSGCTDPDSRTWTLWPCPFIQTIERAEKESNDA